MPADFIFMCLVTHTHTYICIQRYICMYVYTYKYLFHVLIYTSRYVRTVHWDNSEIETGVGERREALMSPRCPFSCASLSGSPCLLNLGVFPARRVNGSHSGGPPDRCRRTNCWSC